MGLQLAAGRPPSLTAEQLRDTKEALARLDGGFDTSLLDYPDLVGRDGRQDFLHFFLYPLMVAPVIPLVEVLSLHPNWAFTAVNALLLAIAFYVAASHGSPAVAVAGFVSPIIWWVDKAHTEAFLFAAVSVAALLVGRQPAVALIAFAAAGAQNAALGVVYPLFALASWRMTPSTFSRRTWGAAVAGAFIVAGPFVYAWVRLRRLSPMAEYAQQSVPTPAAVAAFVLEPNIGLVPNAPVYALAIVAAVGLLIAAVKNADLMPLWWWPAVVQAALLIAWTQNPNLNHGGTPGMNRWVLSLLALSLPWLEEARRMLSAGMRVTFNILLAVTAVMTAAAHLPSQPERYREATRLAERMWQAGVVHLTPAEVFAERTQGREPAFAPGHDGRCHVLLIANQQAPPQCPPPAQPLPSWCRGADVMCYAVAAGDEWRYVPAPNNGFFYRAAEPSWPAGGPLAAGIHRVLRAADPGARVWRVDNARRWRERFAGADIGVVLTTPEVSVVHIRRMSENTRQQIVSDAAVQMESLVPTPDASSSEHTNVALIVRR